MAGDWIKMRTDLYRDPKVCSIADLLMHQEGELAAYVNQNCQRAMTVTRNVMRNVTVGALVSVWGVMRLRGKRINDDLALKSGTLWVIDDLAEIPGFGHALESVGWVVADEDGIVFPNFFSEYNVDPNEDAKAKNAERQRRYREKAKQESNVTQDVTVTSESNTEKRREEKSKPNPLSGKPDAALRIIDHLNASCGTKFEPVEANLKFLRARLSEYPEPTLVAVIDAKRKEWGGTDNAKYLRPATLFNAEKCAQYVGQLNGAKRLSI